MFRSIIFARSLTRFQRTIRSEIFFPEIFRTIIRTVISRVVARIIIRRQIHSRVFVVITHRGVFFAQTSAVGYIRGASLAIHRVIEGFQRTLCQIHAFQMLSTQIQRLKLLLRHVKSLAVYIPAERVRQVTITHRLHHALRQFVLSVCQFGVFSFVFAFVGEQLPGTVQYVAALGSDAVNMVTNP